VVAPLHFYLQALQADFRPAASDVELGQPPEVHSDWGYWMVSILDVWT
jgi:hypothetical protein